MRCIKEFQKDISELCEKCSLRTLILNGIENQILLDANEKKSLLSEELYSEYLNKEIKNASEAMQRVFLIEIQNKNYKTDKHRKKRSEIYIWNKERIKALNKIQNPLSIPNETISQNLNFKLSEYNFYQLEKIKCLSETTHLRLLKLISENKLPYRIAMFNELGFFDFLLKEHCKTKDKLFDVLAKILDESSRSVKGNYYVLEEHSKENRSRYTSHKHKEKVREDYESLK